MTAIIVKENTDTLTLVDIASNPADFPAEVKAAALEEIKNIKAKLREYELNISANVVREMQMDNATKILYVNAKGEDKTLTLKAGPRKLNPAIKNVESFAKENGFLELLGKYEYVPYSWSFCKEARKQGGTIQEVIDKLYIEGQPSIDIK